MSAPPGYHTVTPYLIVPDVQRQLEFLTAAFDADVTTRHEGPDGAVNHAEVLIGDSRVMMGRAQGEWHPMPSMLYLYVDDPDAWHTRAVAAGATSVREPRDEAYGDRAGGVKDAAGNQWWVAKRL